MIYKDTDHFLASAVLTLETKITCAGITRHELSRSLLFLLLKCSSSASAQASGTARQQKSFDVQMKVFEMLGRPGMQGRGFLLQQEE